MKGTCEDCDRTHEACQRGPVPCWKNARLEDALLDVRQLLFKILRMDKAGDSPEIREAKQCCERDTNFDGNCDRHLTGPDFGRDSPEIREANSFGEGMAAGGYVERPSHSHGPESVCDVECRGKG